jgi:hypothetical protein
MPLRNLMAADDYGTLAKMQDAEAQRKSLAEIPYTEAEHQLNPFLGDNETAKAEFTKRDPDLAKFYQEEAQPVELPIFGKNKNQTVVGKLAKDPSTAALVQLAGQIYEQWQAADKSGSLRTACSGRRSTQATGRSGCIIAEHIGQRSTVRPAAIR